MKKNLFSKKAFSMVETVVASIILAVTITAVFATLMVARQPMVQSDKKMRASIFAKKIMENLRSNVDASNWASGPLTVGDFINITDSEFPGYTARYTVTDVGGSRKVVLTVSW